MFSALIAGLPNWVLAAACAPVLVTLLIVGLGRPDLVLILGVFPAFVVPRAVLSPGGTQVATADVVFVGVFFLWLGALASRRSLPPWLKNNPFLRPSLVWVGVVASSLLWTQDASQTLSFIIQMVEIVLLIPLAFASLPRSVSSIRRAMFVFIIVTSLIAAATLAGGRDGLAGAGLGKNVAGTFIGAGLVLAFTFALISEERRARGWLIAATLLLAVGLMNSVSRGSIIGSMVAILAISGTLQRRRLLIVFVAAVGALAFLATYGLGSADREKTTSGAYVSGSYDTGTVRKYSYSDAVEKIKARPFLGTGAGTYQDYVAELGFELPDPNNLFLLTWAELGIPGMLALLFLLGRFVRGFAVVRRLSGEARAPAAAAGGVAVSLFIHFQVDVSWTRGTTTLAFAMIGIMYALQRLSVGEPEPKPARVHGSRLLNAPMPVGSAT